MEVDHTLDHTAQSQFDGWDITNAKIINYMNSPLAKHDALEGFFYEADDLWRKTVTYNSDHAADVVAVARKTKERKVEVIEADLGREKLQGMSESKAEEALWEVAREMCDDPDGLDNRCLSPQFCLEYVVSRLNIFQCATPGTSCRGYAVSGAPSRRDCIGVLARRAPANPLSHDHRWLL
jgi:hypothetical protein